MRHKENMPCGRNSKQKEERGILRDEGKYTYRKSESTAYISMTERKRGE
jgi:hypothetical protein